MNEKWNDTLGRRDFLKKSAYTALAVSLIAFAGCESDSGGGGDGGGGGGGGDSGGGKTYSDISGAISANHGHSVTLTAVQQAAGTAVSLTLTTGDGHTHTLSLSDRQVQALANGGDETGESSVDAGHSHAVRFRA